MHLIWNATVVVSCDSSVDEQLDLSIIMDRAGLGSIVVHSEALEPISVESCNHGVDWEEGARERS